MYRSSDCLARSRLASSSLYLPSFLPVSYLHANQVHTCKLPGAAIPAEVVRTHSQAGMHQAADATTIRTPVAGIKAASALAVRLPIVEAQPVVQNSYILSSFASRPEAEHCMTLAFACSERVCDPSDAATPHHSVSYQQNSWRHCEQFMCMQPWFFSMGRLHLGHGFVLAMIQFKFSDSALFFSSHVATVVQSTCNQQGSIPLELCIVQQSIG